MPIVNHTHHPYIYSTKEVTTIEYRSQSPYWSVKDWHNGKTYWFCAVFHGGGLDSVDFSKLIPNEVLEDESIFIVLCPEFEMFTDIVDPIYTNLIQRLQINPKRILLLSENVDIYKVVELVASAYKLDTINVEWTVIHERGGTSQVQLLESTEVESAKTLEKKTYQKSFLNFNGRWRSHRPCAVALLHCMGLLDKGYVSLGKADDNLNWNNTFDTFSKLVEDDIELYSLLVNNKDSILSLPDLYLDTTDLVTNRNRILQPDINHSETIKLYENSYFSLVSETNFFGNCGRHLTEKAFKPIIYKHPFMLISDRHTLALFKQLGYKTFHPFIDESYDNEPNDTKRLKMILNEVDRLSNLSEPELFEFIGNVREITIFNYNLLLSRPKFSHAHKIL